MTKVEKSQSNLVLAFEGLVSECYKLKARAIQDDDYELYIWFLKEWKKEWSKLYVATNKEDWETFYGLLIKFGTSELQESMINYNKSKVPF